MTSMVAKASSGTTSQLLPTLPANEKGSRNKRKFHADPLVDPNKIETFLPDECSNFEFSTENFGLTPSHEHPCVCNKCSDDRSDDLKLNLGLPMPNQHSEKTEAFDESHDADWSDLTEGELEALVLSNLETIIRGAIKQVVESGYSEEIATNAVLKSGLCHVFKVTASNIGENALSFLKNSQGNNNDLCFGGLKQMAKYILTELVSVLREVRPLFSTGDAMWCLLISDLSLSHACAMDVDIGNSVVSDSKTSESNSDPVNGVPSAGNISENCIVQLSSETKTSKVEPPAQVQLSSENKTSKVEPPNSCKPNPLARCAPTCHCERSTLLQGSNLLNPKSSLDIGGLYVDKESTGSTGKAHCHGREEKIGTSKKVSGITKKEYILRQKSLQFDKGFRTYSCKGFSRTSKISAFGGLVFDKRPKSSVDSSYVSVKNISLKISKTMGADMPCDKKTHNLLTKIGLSSPLDLNLDKGNTNSTSSKSDVSLATRVSNAPALSAADTELSLSLPTNVEAPNPSMGPFEKKDEMILKLVPKVKELENELQEWSEWANQKIMQAARRLGKDKSELKALRQEKEEVERLKREKQMLEESTMKKLSDMENNLYKSSVAVEQATASLKRLEEENGGLRLGMEAATLRAAESAANYQEALKREKKTMAQSHSSEKQKIMLQEELAAGKQKLAQVQQQLDRAIEFKDKFEAKWKLEEKSKNELLRQAASILKKRQEFEASGMSKGEAANSKAQSSLQKYKDDIEKLRREISQLRLKSESSKIDALRKGIDGSYVEKSGDRKNLKAPLKENEGTGGVKRERECVMCLSEEMSVVFLPCAHQVVCKTCNVTHEKQGMKDCPSCRTTIQRRISVLYARP